MGRSVGLIALVFLACGRPPASAGGKVVLLDGGAADAGARYTGPIDVGPDGGKVDHLYFAVIGDTRPRSVDVIAQYPGSVIEAIYADIEGMRPWPQFAVTTGDYVFATPGGQQASEQLGLYLAAQHHYSGTVFAAMGNHECTGFTAGNCAQNPTSNFLAFMSSLVAPLGKSAPYYSIPFEAKDGAWTAKLVIVACNAWDYTQKSWLDAELVRPTTYTFVVRHEPAHATTGPCVGDVEALLAAHPYSLSIVGHTHTFALKGREVIVGNGGAPLEGPVPFGYATVEQGEGGFIVTQYDSATAMPVSSAVVPY